MYRLKDSQPPGWSVVYTDVESAPSEAHFVARLLAAVYETNPPGAQWKRLGERLSGLLDRVGKVGAGPIQVELAKNIDEHWQEVGADLFRVLSRVEQPLLLMVDEFPIFVRRTLDLGQARARLLLDWFRALRLGEEVQSTGARFLLAGSIGLDGVVSRASNCPPRSSTGSCV
ncbi:MAG: hypothetical protein JRI25_05700 [Deltaproteobacteria bacterium]|nr:hypothetical protein [Deltaproteobacteria bacterium]